MNVPLLVMLLLTLLAAAWLSRPWWRRERGSDLRRKSVNVAAYRQRLVEIDTEVAAGLVSAEAAAALRDESAARLLVDATDNAPVPQTESAVRRRAALILGALLAVFAGGYYYSAGSWKEQQLVTGEREPDPLTPAAVDQMVARLAQRMEQNPENAEGWAMLGQTYFTMQRYQDAAKAYARLNALTENRDPDALTGEGEALALAADRQLSGRPRELFEQALGVQPDHPKSLWYAGMAAYQAGDAAVAIKHWTVLRGQTLPDELRDLLDQHLAELGAPAAGSSAASSAAPAKSGAAAANAVELHVDVSLSPQLADKIPADATLIVFARAENGPPMPLAVYRAPVGNFPQSIKLDDSMSMMPSLKLSMFEHWTVTARISRSGQAKAESGDLQGSIAVGREQASQPLSLVIDQVVP